jgi:hypothetical protein
MAAPRHQEKPVKTKLYAATGCTPVIPVDDTGTRGGTAVANQKTAWHGSALGSGPTSSRGVVHQAGQLRQWPGKNNFASLRRMQADSVVRRSGLDGGLKILE